MFTNFEPLPDKTPVLLFCRVSTDHQDYNYQINELNRYCDQNNYQIVHTIANNISGRRGKKRPDLEELFQLAKKGLFKKVVITSLERLGRDAKMIRRTIDYLHSRKISIVFKNQGFESLDDQGEETFVTNILISVYAEVAEEENRMKSQKVKSAHAYRKQMDPDFKLGRPKDSIKTPDKLLKEYSRLAKDLQQGFSLIQCMRLHNVSKNTVIKVKRAMAA